MKSFLGVNLSISALNGVCKNVRTGFFCAVLFFHTFVNIYVSESIFFAFCE